MKKGDYELIPYVNYIFNDPKQGIAATHEGPRYSSGFASMFHSYGMMTENQIYRKFSDRVKSCYQFIRVLVEFTAEKIEVPEMYILPQSYRDIVERLDITGVSYSKLKNDTLIEVTVDYIDEYTSPPRPYNGHFYHDIVTTRSEKQKIQYYAGDLLIPVRQEKIKYIIEMFEPKASDSFFRWNFFDNILDQREYFSSY